MRFDKLKITGLLVLSLILVVGLAGCNSGSLVESGSDGGVVGEHEVTVLVVDGAEQGLTGVGVTLGELEQETAENGAAVFPEVKEGSYQLAVDYAGYTVQAGDTGTVTVGEELTDFTVELAAAGDDPGDNEDGSDDGSDSGDDGQTDSGDDSTGDDGTSDDGDTGDDGQTDSGDDTSGDDSSDSDDGDTGGDDGSTDGDDTGDDSSEPDPGTGDYNQSGVMQAQFESSENKVVNLGRLAAGETAIVAVSPLNLDPNYASTYNANLNITYSDGTLASQSAVSSLDSYDPEETESSPQAELDAELRQLENDMLAQDLKPAAEDRTDVSVQETYQLGDSRSFYNRFDQQVNSRLAAIGENVLIYLEDGYSLNNSTLEELADTFDQKINSSVMNNFAFYNQAEYDWDGNGRTTILIEDMGGSLSGGMIMGYFYSRDYYDDAYVYGNSNEADMFYINYQGVKEAEVNSYFQLDSVLATIAHEYQHLIFFVNKMNSGRDPYSTDTWINEGFSMLAEYLAGYRDYSRDYRVTDHYFPYPDQTSVLAWEGSPRDYGASGLIAYYLYENLGSRIIEDIQTGSYAPSQVISRNYTDFSGLLLDWMLTNYTDSDSLNGYNYSGFNLATRPAVEARIDGSFSGNFSVKSTGVSYFELEGNGSNVSLELDNLNTDAGVIIYHDGAGS